MDNIATPDDINTAEGGIQQLPGPNFDPPPPSLEWANMDILPIFYNLSRDPRGLFTDPFPSLCPLNYRMPPEDECTNNDSTNDDCQPSKINPNASVNFNMEGLKDMLKCANCHRFLFPPILQ